MFLVLILLPVVAVAAADWLHYRRRVHALAPWRRRLFVAWCCATDALPVLLLLAGLLLPDNPTALVRAMMWGVWVWMLAAVPRGIYYLFSLVGLRRAGWGAGLAAAALLVWGATGGRTRIEVRRMEVRSDRLPAAFDSLRVVQLTDIHVGTLVAPERELARLVDSVEALRPDLVLFCGDLVNIRSSEMEGAPARILGRLRAPLGVYSVLGNHDVGTYIKDTAALRPETSRRRLVETQQAMGWRVLEDTTLWLRRRGDSISLSGISFDPSLRERRHDRRLPLPQLDRIYRDLPADAWNITLTHLPQYWDAILDHRRGDLTLAGHVHAMQLKVRLFGRSYSPARLLYTRWSGRYDERGRTLSICDGSGYVGYPLRLGAPPQITLITLRRCESPSPRP